MNIPDDAQERSNKVYNLTDAFLRRLREELDGLIVADLGVIIYRVVGALRSAMDLPSTADYVGNMLLLAERVLQELAETGGVVLAEHYVNQPDRDAIVEDLNDGFTSDTVPEEWLKEASEEE